MPMVKWLAAEPGRSRTWSVQDLVLLCACVAICACSHGNVGRSSAGTWEASSCIECILPVIFNQMGKKIMAASCVRE